MSQQPPQIIYVQGPPPRKDYTALYLFGGLAIAVLSAPVLCCGGCMMLGVVSASRIPPDTRTDAQKKEDTKVSFYTPIQEVACATDPDFLDSSPFLSPANFARVEPGTRLRRVGFGGLSGKMYWKLSAGGRELIYVYRDDFDSQFRELPEEPESKAAGSGTNLYHYQAAP